MSTNKLRTLSVTGIVVSLLIAAGSAWAHDDDYGYARRYRHPHRRAVVVMPPPVVAYGYPARPVYYAPPPPVYYAPAPAYYEPPPVYAPAPAYYAAPPVAYAPLGAIGGAVAGAAIGSGFGHGDRRVAAIAIGSVVGAFVGDSLARGR